MAGENLYDHINRVNWTERGFNSDKAYVCSKFSQLIYGYKPKESKDRTNFYEITPQVLDENPTIRVFYDLLFNSDFILLFIVETPSSVTIGVSFYRAIIVASRGTSYWKDWGINLNLFRKNILKYQHLKFHRGFNKIAIDTAKRMHSLLATKSIPVYFTGHSLGAALSGIFYYYFTTDDISAYRLPNDNANSAYTFAMPRFKNRQVNRLEHLFHLYSPVDLIPKIPPKFFGYINSETEYELNPLGLELKVQRKPMTFAQGLKLILTGKMVKEHSIETYISMLQQVVRN